MYQKTILIGRIGGIKEKATPSGKAVALYSVATSKSYKDKGNGEWVEKVEWHRLVSYDKCGEHVIEKLEKGDLIQVEGELQTRKWTDDNGVERWTTEIIVRDFPKKLPKFFNKDPQAHGYTPAVQQQAVGQGFDSDAGMPGPDDQFDDDIPL